MPDRTQDLKNHRQVALACKNYTDTEIKKSEERILSIVARNNVDFIDHINEPTYRFTAPLNSKLLMLESIAGNSNKIAPSTPSDDSVARLKTIPDNTYKSQIDYIGGKSVKYNQLVQNGNFESVDGWTSWVYGNQYSINNNECHIYGLTSNDISSACSIPANHKCLILYDIKGNEYSTKTYLGFSNSAGSIAMTTMTTSYQTISAIITTLATPTRFYIYAQGNNANNEAWIRRVEIIDLTDIFGAGNEPSTVETAIPLLKANGYKLDGTDTYSTGELKHAIVSGVKYSPINEFNPSDCWYTSNGNVYTTDGVSFNTTPTFTKGNINDSPSGFWGYVRIDIKNKDYVSVSGMPVLYGVKQAVITDENYNILNSFVSNNDIYNVSTIIGRKYLLYVTNKPSTADYSKAMFEYSSSPSSSYIPYVAPITKAIPSQVLALDGYGMGRSNVYNYIDCNTNEFVLDCYTQVFTGLEAGWELRSGNLHTFAITCNNFPKRPKNNILQNTTTETFGWTKLAPNEIDIKDGVYTNYTGQLIVTILSCSTLAEFQAYLQTHLLALNYDVAQVKTDVSQYFTDGWNKVDLDNLYASCEMVCDESIDMPNKVEYYGTIIHSLATAVKQEGFNVWNEVWENGYINTATGANVPASTTIRSKDYIDVLPSTTYYFYTTLTPVSSYSYTVIYYDSNKNVIGNDSGAFNTSKTTPNNCYFIRFYVASNNVAVYENNICINISGTLNGTYKPHKPTITRLLPNSEAKYSWGITDGVRNTRVFCDDECNPVNEGQLDVNNVDLGIPNWLISNNLFATSLSTLRGYPFISAMYQFAGDINIGNVQNMEGITRDGDIYLRNDSYSTPEAFKTAMSGEILCYQKNATGTETLDDFDFSFDCEEGDTFTIIGCELLQCYATYSFLIKEAKSNE